MSDSGPPRSRLGNTDYQWGQFDPEAYFQHYYGEPHPDDERAIRCTVEAMKLALPIGAELVIPETHSRSAFERTKPQSSLARDPSVRAAAHQVMVPVRPIPRSDTLVPRARLLPPVAAE